MTVMEHNDGWLIPESFGARLRSVRRHLGIEQHAFAEALEMQQGTLAKWERDETYPRRPHEVAATVAAMTGCSATWLLWGIDGPQPSPTAVVNLRRMVREHLVSGPLRLYPACA